MALLHLSLAEDLGLTVLDAFACGCPVVAADTPTLREIAGLAGLEELRVAAAKEGTASSTALPGYGIEQHRSASAKGSGEGARSAGERGRSRLDGPSPFLKRGFGPCRDSGVSNSCVEGAKHDRGVGAGAASLSACSAC